MDLIRREQPIWRHAQRRRHARAVLGDLFRRIVGADAAIERSIEALRYAAGSREESVANARERGK